MAEETKAPEAPQQSSGGKSGSGLEPNVAGMLCYAPYIGFVVSIVFLIIEKDAKVKFNAAQSLTLSVAYFILAFVWNMVLGAMTVGSLFSGGFGFASLLWSFSWIFAVAYIILTIMLMIKAYNGEEWELPVVGKIARNFVK